MAKTRVTPRKVLSSTVKMIADLYKGLDQVERQDVLSILQGIDSESAFRDDTKKERVDAETAEEKMPHMKKRRQN